MGPNEVYLRGNAKRKQTAMAVRNGACCGRLKSRITGWDRRIHGLKHRVFVIDFKNIYIFFSITHLYLYLSLNLKLPIAFEEKVLYNNKTLD